MKLLSTAFENNQQIPPKYTCDGENINPPLHFSEIPLNTQSLVLIIDDPDAPSGDWVHWLVWNIEPSTTLINENSFPPNSIEGTTSFGKPGYGGPCPPNRTHRYYFKIYALDKKLNLNSSNNKQDILNAMPKHILDSAELIGLYQRQN